MTTRTITIELPLPARTLSPNARVHHMPLARAKKRYRAKAKLLTFIAIRRIGDPPLWQQATALCRFYWPTNRRRDKDNALASMKSGFDGVRDAGLIADDSGLTHLPSEFYTDPIKPRVEIELVGPWFGAVRERLIYPAGVVSREGDGLRTALDELAKLAAAARAAKEAKS